VVIVVEPVATTPLPPRPGVPGARSEDPRLEPVAGSAPLDPPAYPPADTPAPARFGLTPWSFSAFVPWSSPRPEADAAAPPDVRGGPAHDAAPTAAGKHHQATADGAEAGTGSGATWIVSSHPAPRALDAHGTHRVPMRRAPLPAPTVPLPPPTSGAFGSGHTPFDLSQQLGRSQLWAVMATAAGVAAAMTGRWRRIVVAVTPVGACGNRPPFTPD